MQSDIHVVAKKFLVEVKFAPMKFAPFVKDLVMIYTLPYLPHPSLFPYTLNFYHAWPIVTLAV